ncbi:gluconokinase [Myxosarcina sp. GI1(2024)]
MFYIIMGVSGSGKTTVGRLLSERLGIPFYDADDFHPQANIDKMSKGIPLDDRDRQPWLLKLRDLIEDTLSSGKQGVLACSALKSKYRQTLQGDRIKEITWIYLKGDYNLIKQRMRQRQEHFLDEDMLRSQFEALEEPKAALTIDITYSPEEIVAQILGKSDR